MEPYLDPTTFRCNACGHKHEVAHYCDHCGTPMCPECKRAGCITNIVEMRRVVSQSAILKSQMSKSQKRKKTIKDPEKRLEQLREQMKQGR